MNHFPIISFWDNETGRKDYRHRSSHNEIIKWLMPTLGLVHNNETIRVGLLHHLKLFSCFASANSIINSRAVSYPLNWDYHQYFTKLLGSILARKFLSNKVRIRRDGAIPELKCKKFRKLIYRCCWHAQFDVIYGKYVTENFQKYIGKNRDVTSGRIHRSLNAGDEVLSLFGFYLFYTSLNPPANKCCKCV